MIQIDNLFILGGGLLALFSMMLAQLLSVQSFHIEMVGGGGLVLGLLLKARAV